MAALRAKAGSDHPKSLAMQGKARAEALRPVLDELKELTAKAIAEELNGRAVPTPAAAGMLVRSSECSAGWGTDMACSSPIPQVGFR